MLAVANMASTGGSSTRRPPLANGEFLHSQELVLRNECQLQVAALVASDVHLGSAICVRHRKPEGIIQAWFDTYAGCDLETATFTNPTVIFDAANVMRPAAHLRRRPEHDTLSRVNQNECRRQLLDARSVLPQPRLHRPPLAAAPRLAGDKSPSRKLRRQAQAADSAWQPIFTFTPCDAGADSSLDASGQPRLIACQFYDETTPF